MYEKLDIKKKRDCKIVFDNTKMKYLFVDEQMIDLQNFKQKTPIYDRSF